MSSFRMNYDLKKQPSASATMSIPNPTPSLLPNCFETQRQSPQADDSDHDNDEDNYKMNPTPQRKRSPSQRHPRTEVPDSQAFHGRYEDHENEDIGGNEEAWRSAVDGASYISDGDTQESISIDFSFKTPGPATAQAAPTGVNVHDSALQRASHNAENDNHHTKPRGVGSSGSKEKKRRAEESLIEEIIDENSTSNNAQAPSSSSRAALQTAEGPSRKKPSPNRSSLDITYTSPSGKPTAGQESGARRDRDQYGHNQGQGHQVQGPAGSSSSSSRGTKIVESVRSRSLREVLPGHTCTECKRYYEAMVDQGIIISDELVNEMLRKCSRHKAHTWGGPPTPDGFWELSVKTPEEWKK